MNCIGSRWTIRKTVTSLVEAENRMMVREMRYNSVPDAKVGSQRVDENQRDTFPRSFEPEMRRKAVLDRKVHANQPWMSILSVRYLSQDG